MREDDGGGAGVEDVAHYAGGHMRQIAEHAEAIHFTHDFSPEWRQAAVSCRVQRGVGPVEGDVVGQRHVARPEVVIRSQHLQGVLDGVAAFHAEQRADLVRRKGTAHIGGRGGEHEAFGIFRDHAPREPDLLELRARVARYAAHLSIAPVVGRVGLTRNIDRPELRTNHPLLHAREVGHARRALPKIVRVEVVRVKRILANAPRQIVMPIHQRGGTKDGLRAREIRIARLRAKRGDGHRDQEDQSRHGLQLNVHGQRAHRDLRVVSDCGTTADALSNRITGGAIPSGRGLCSPLASRR